MDFAQTMKNGRPVLSAQASAFLEATKTSEDWLELDLVAQREDATEVARRFSGPAEPVASIEDLDADGPPARLYRPVGGEQDVLVWLHGGGWMLGGLDDHDALASALANRAGCAVLSVGYRLAPEHPYPAAIEDAWSATRWASERFERVAVGGDSSGGNLAAAVALRARDAGLELALQLLVYPVLDPRLDSPWVQDFVSHYTDFAGKAQYGEAVLEEVRHVCSVYIPEPSCYDERDAAPARATSLEGVAPALILLAEHDVLRGQCEDYARRLHAAGITVDVHTYAGQIHGFCHLLEAMPDAHDLVDRSAAALSRVFAR